MGKHAKTPKFERVKRDFYPTPLDAVIPLFPHLPKNYNFIEPCAGDGRLIRHLEGDGHRCIYAADIEPQAEGIERRDCLMIGEKLPPCEAIITNPPWEREPLHKMIDLFRNHAPTWLLFDAGWMFTGQAAPYLPFCHSIVTVGRVKWFENSKGAGMEDCAWYGFTKHEIATVFYGK